MSQEINLRDATEQDYEFLYDLHRETLKEYVGQTWGWDEDWQANYFREKFDVSGRRIIQQNGADIGCITVRDKGTHIFLAYIALVPAFQRKGIGTQLIEEILNEANRKQKPVTLKVLKTNPARALYERLGFTVIEITDTHYFMKADTVHGSI